ncbi:MAG: ABC transporter substrate-binding protein [Rhodoferax sp.]|nr:ABC transporter substrate-binding protein [Rhodoferax sp.]
MSLNLPLHRRTVLLGAAGVALAHSTPTWAQTQRTGGKMPTLVQIADMSAGQIDVTKDFTLGTRAAWQDINAKGGLRGRPLTLQTLEVDGTTASLRTAIEAIRAQPAVVGLLGTVGDRAASQVADLLRRELPDIAHIAPWLQDSRQTAIDNTFSIFASRQEQIAHAIKSLSVMGINELGAVYATPAEYAAYREEVDQVALALKLRLRTYGPVADLEQLGRTLTPDSPRIVIFLGGTPELLQFSQGIGKQVAQRYIVAMADVNLQTLSQLGLSRNAAVIATQVVPLVNAALPVVRAYRETLGRLYDEPPTPQSLAGFMAGRYSYEVLLGIDGGLSRQTVLQAFQRRGAWDLGGFRVDTQSRQRGNAYVTQSMISADGRVVG